MNGSKRQASSKENNNSSLHGSGFIDNMKYKKGVVGSTGQIQKTSYKSQTLSNRNTANSTTRMMNAHNHVMRDGPSANSTLNQSSMH